MIRVWTLLRSWLGLASPSRAAEEAGRKLGEVWTAGIRRGEERRKAGLPPEPLSDEAIAYAAGVVHRVFPSLYEDEKRPSRSYWTSPDTWCDPDCFECGGEGAPCCEPPDYPYPECCGGTGMADYAAVPCPNPGCPVPPR